jgi:hypothetical protein
MHRLAQNNTFYLNELTTFADNIPAFAASFDTFSSTQSFDRLWAYIALYQYGGALPVQ